MVMWKGIRVGKARKQYGVEYPDMYSQESKVPEVALCLRFIFLLATKIKRPV